MFSVRVSGWNLTGWRRSGFDYKQGGYTNHEQPRHRLHSERLLILKRMLYMVGTPTWFLVVWRRVPHRRLYMSLVTTPPIRVSKAAISTCVTHAATTDWRDEMTDVIWKDTLEKACFYDDWIGNSHVPGEYWRLLFGGSLPRTTRRAPERSSTYDPWSVIRTGSVIIYSEFRCRWSRLLWWIVTIVANLTLLASPARYSNMLFDRIEHSIKQHIRIPGRWS